MIYELREYRTQLGQTAAFVERFGSDLAVWFERCGFTLIGAWTTYIGAGASAEFVWLVRWADDTAREAAFARLRAEPGYAAYLAANGPRNIQVTNRFMRAVPFSPLG